MTNRIDESWYQKTLGIRQDISAGGVIVRWVGGILYVALVREEAFADFILPKGHVEPGESLETAAKREIAEEAGLQDIDLVCELGIQERKNFRKSAWKVIHYFLFVSRDSGGQPTDTSHQYRCEWFPIGKLPTFFWPEQRSLLEANREKIIQLTSSAHSSSARSHHSPA
jgi:ADP-ribose pyrophosphatase YjhB (NUDIX family)